MPRAQQTGARGEPRIAVHREIGDDVPAWRAETRDPDVTHARLLDPDGARPTGPS